MAASQHLELEPVVSHALTPARAQEQLERLATEHGERVLASPNNPISLAMTLSSLESAERARTDAQEPSKSAEPASCECYPAALEPAQHSGPSVTFFGAMLWQRGVSGAAVHVLICGDLSASADAALAGVRVIATGKEHTVAGCNFRGYGSSCSNYPQPYMTAAAALGGTREEVDLLVTRVRKCFAEFSKKQAAVEPATRS